MRILHTSDWHVGKKIRGNSRADEHRAVLGEIIDLADRQRVDVVIVAGDLFETASPTPEWAPALPAAPASRRDLRGPHRRERQPRQTILPEQCADAFERVVEHTSTIGTSTVHDSQ